jgi:hypothetical protein
MLLLLLPLTQVLVDCSSACRLDQLLGKASLRVTVLGQLVLLVTRIYVICPCAFRVSLCSEAIMAESAAQLLFPRGPGGWTYPRMGQFRAE